MRKVKWTELAPTGVFADDKLSETTEYKVVERTGLLVCAYKSFWGKVYGVVEVEGGFEEIPLTDLKPAVTVYEIQDEPLVMQ
jgi:hypothetical protein